jgi:5-methylthioadenosine/S-adenosylhomocysteine deaminase
MSTTVIRNAAWVIAWDEAADHHVYRRGADIAFSEDGIAYIGRGYRGTIDRVIDGSDLMVMPGLVDIHAHPHHEPLYRGLREEHGVASMHMTGLYERGQAFSAPDDAGRAAAAEFAYCELMLGGVTSLVDISAPWDGWVELFAKSGMRGFLAPGYASARWFLENDRGPSYDWNEPRGRSEFATALRIIDEALGHQSGRLSGVISPMQIDTCSEDLLRDSRDAARERCLAFTTHCSQSVNEVGEMVRRHGLTPIQWAGRIGLLGPGTILGHALYLDTHSWVRWHTNDDLRLLGDSGTAVAHCPTPFARYGHVMEHFGAYRDAGVVMGMGTDCSPHNLLEEMRKGSVLARIAARHIHAVDVGDFLHAATVGGAKALLRDDIGRLAPGKKADLVLVDLGCPGMRPVRDPLRSLVYHAADRAVRDVFVNGVQVVADRRVLTLDQTDAADRLAAAQARMEAAAPQRDYLRRRAEEIAPLSLPVAE